MDALPGESESSGGFYYQLVERQINIEEQSQFIRYVIRILDNEGISNMSDILAEFDPSYSTLSFHKILVHRNGKTINKLQDHEIRTIQREADMERKIYDGYLTAYVNLRDIRKGDILEYAYSINGYNPIYEKHFDNIAYLEYSMPVEQYYFRLIENHGAKLHFHYFNDAEQPQIESHPGVTTYTWNLKKRKALFVEDDVPDWYNPYKSFLVSDFGSWNEIVNLIHKQYILTDQQLGQLKEVATEIFKGQSIEENILDAIRFVQDDVRYLGLEHGLSSYKPHAPQIVYLQRFGDCKDKTLLLHALLSVLGVESYPLLVEMNGGYLIEEDAPSLAAFNHVVLQILLDCRTIYVDPTISSQGGQVDSIYFPYYRKGLIIKKGENKLTELPEPNNSFYNIDEYFTLDEIGGDAILDIKTEYYGMYADRQRDYFSNFSIDYCTKQYTEYYSFVYPEIESLEDVAISDNRDNGNVFTTIEKYRITNIWYEDPEDSNMIVCDFTPLQVNTEIPVTSLAIRTMPFFLPFPSHVFQKTTIQLPEPWYLDMKSVTFDEEEFKYVNDVKLADNIIVLTNSFKTYSDHVRPEKFSSFSRKVEQISDISSIRLYYDKTIAAAGGNQDLSKFAVIISLLTLIASLFIFSRLYRRFNPEPQISSLKFNRPIGGWLILFAIGLIFSPINILSELFVINDYFSEDTWSFYSSRQSQFYNPWLVFMLAVELIYNTAVFVYLVMLIILFYNRRTNFPTLVV
ncbi:MAG: DUF3857 domain-containing protein, partial [bacterium]